MKRNIRRDLQVAESRPRTAGKLEELFVMQIVLTSILSQSMWIESNALSTKMLLRVLCRHNTACHIAIALVKSEAAVAGPLVCNEHFFYK